MHGFCLGREERIGQVCMQMSFPLNMSRTQQNTVDEGERSERPHRASKIGGPHLKKPVDESLVHCLVSLKVAKKQYRKRTCPCYLMAGWSTDGQILKGPQKKQIKAQCPDRRPWRPGARTGRISIDSTVRHCSRTGVWANTARLQQSCSCRRSCLR